MEYEDTAAEIICLFVLVDVPAPLGRCVIPKLCEIHRQRPTSGVPFDDFGPEGVQGFLAVIWIARWRAAPVWINLGRGIYIVGVHCDTVGKLQEAMFHGALEPLDARPPPKAGDRSNLEALRLRAWRGSWWHRIGTCRHSPPESRARSFADWAHCAFGLQ